MKKKGWGTFVPRECYLQRAIAVSSAATLPISLAAAFISAAFSLGLNPFFFFPIGVPSFLSARSTPCGALRASRLRVRFAPSSTLGSLRSPFPLLMMIVYHTNISMSILLKNFFAIFAISIHSPHTGRDCHEGPHKQRHGGDLLPGSVLKNEKIFKKRLDIYVHI